MADILLDEQSVPASPAAGQGLLYPDSTVSRLAYLDDEGRRFIVGGEGNASIANQVANAADTYLTDSDIMIPSFGL